MLIPKPRYPYPGGEGNGSGSGSGSGGGVGGGNSSMPPVYITFNDPGAPGSGGWVTGPSDGGGTGDGSGDGSSSGGGGTGGSSGPRSWHWGGAAGRIWDDTGVPLTTEELTALNLI